MKINSLTLKNIHSLKGLHEVNFASGPLAQTGLFSITGPTGSGKSTLLDAITLALYNCTPRSGGLSKNSIEKSGALITRNTDDAFCEVKYESGNKTFRSRWEISRARTGNLRDYHMTLAVKTPSGKFELMDLKKGDVPAKNAEIIGLNYDQFIRSILLSQGEFAKFLKSTPKERSALLEKITGTEIYREIGRTAFEKQKLEKSKLEHLHGRLGDIVLLGDEELTTIKEELDAFHEKIVKSRHEIKRIHEKIAVKKELKQKNEWIQKLKEEIIKLRGQQDGMREEAAKLAVHSALLPLKSDIDKFVWLNGQTAATEKKCRLEQENLVELKSGIEKLSQEIRSETEKLEASRHEYEKLQPVIRQVKNLDRRLEIKRTEKAQLDRQLKGIEEEMATADHSIMVDRKELEGINQKLQNIDRFFGENPGLEALAGVLPNVAGRKELLDRKALALEQKLKKEDPSLAHEMSGSAEMIRWVEILEKKTAGAISDKQKMAAEFEADIPERQQLIGRMEAMADEAQAVTDLARLAKQLGKSTEDLEKFILQLDEIRPTIRELEKDRQTTAQAIEIAVKKVDELQVRRERESLEASYEEARQKLEPGEPCPLCGSTHHPFVDSYENQLQETGRALNARKEQLSKLRKELEALNEKISGLKSTESGVSGNISRLEAEIGNLRSDIQNPAGRLGLPAEAVSPGDVEKKKKQLYEKQRFLKNQLLLLDRLEQVEKKIAGLKLLSQNTGELAELEQSIKEAISPFENYISEASGLNEALEKLNTKQRHYEEGIKQKAEYHEKKVRVATAIKEKQTQFSELKKEKETVAKELQGVAEEIEGLSGERENIFGTKDPDREDKAAAGNIRQLEKHLAGLDSKLGIANEKAAASGQEVSRLKSEGVETDREINHLQTKLLPRLKKFEITSVDEASEKMLDDDEAEAIRQRSDKLNSQIDKAGQSLTDAQQQAGSLTAKDHPGISLPELEEKAEEMEAAVSAWDREIGNHTARLNRDSENRERYSGLREEISKQEKEFARWEALNNLIGDREGSKFSKFAQQLTLIQMLGAANQHLKRLTERYIIINESSSGDDELFVIDTFHGDEKRSVKTLSGGESFLVSLALALGLSDLAGSKTKINSLFIDEGFGSLDQQTLDIALSTLERLQHETNRTIGVISHVEALKERITTRIELSQDASGKSSLTIKV